MTKAHTAVAVIPARGGSKRVPDKNILPLGGRPVISYAIEAAKESGLFSDVIVSTDSEKIAGVARECGASVPFMRPDTYAGDKSPDIGWVLHALEQLKEQGKEFDAYSILRPTSPFRTKETIQRAWNLFINANGADSLRAVEKCSQHPCKMWVVRGDRLLPLIPFGPEDTPWHSSQYQSLPEVYVQNASLEIAWTKMTLRTKTIAGVNVVPFFTKGYEGFDINSPADWELAEKLVSEGKI